MRNSFLLAKIFGIEVRADYSWFLGLGLVIWSLGAHYFPMTYPGLAGVDVWSLAVAAGVFAFVSIVFHELAHSLVSYATGNPVHVIVLHVFGGLAQLNREPKRARDEFLMALAGPVASLVLALGFGALGWAGPERVGLKMAAFGRWLGMINLILAAFNMIPGFPLDGGRVLRSILWGVTGNFGRATKIAGVTGQIAAFAFIAWGIAEVFRGNWADGLWIAFVGWFLQNAAGQSIAQVALQDALAGQTAADVMMTDCPHVPPAMTLEKLVNDVAIPSGRRCFPVMGGDRVTGLITLHELSNVPRAQWSTTTVGTAMKLFGDLETVEPETPLVEVVARMVKADVAQIPVVQEKRLRGMVSRDRIMAYLQARHELGV
jgi:Zn-dependent protease/predicted transcriptional regulator